MLVEPVENLLRGEHPQPCGRQLQGQWNPVQSMAERRDGLVVLVGDPKAGRHSLRALGEEHDGVVPLRAPRAAVSRQGRASPVGARR